MTDSITFQKNHWEITIGGVTMDIPHWQAHPRCQISESIMRKRCNKQLKHPDKFSVRWVVFAPPARGGAPIKHKSMKNRERVEKFESWEAERSRVATSAHWTPALVRKRRFFEMSKGTRWYRGES